MPDHTPRDDRDERPAQASSMNEENPPTVPEGIAVRDMIRVKYEPRASNEGRAAREPPARSRIWTGTSSTTCRRPCCPLSSA